MMDRRRFLSPLIGATIVGAPLVIGTRPALAQASGGSLITGIYQILANGRTFAGTLTITGFTLVNGVLNAVGTITGTLTNASGTVIGTLTSAPITIPLTAFTGTCTILTLHTGTINLNLLGLNVLLSPIDLVITATAAPGNLLGTLLCAVVHLLDTGGTLTALTDLLNQILGALAAA